MKNALIVLLVVVAFGVGVVVGGTPIGSIPASIISGPNTSPNTSATATGDAGGTTVPTSRLSEAQRKMLSALGINADEIVVTPAMEACADTQIGTARMAEIKGGATPSMSEGVKLLGCYRGN